MTKPNPNAPADPRTCHHCGGKVRGGGPRTADGVYFCSQPECIAAKKRHWYRESNQVDQRPMAPTICSSCGCALKPRKVRHGEAVGLGRWCDKPACRRHRAATMRVGTVATVGDVERMKLEIEFYGHALKFDRVTCLACGVEDAVHGYPHPDAYGEKCTGTGERWVSKLSVGRVWPDRWFVEGDTLAPHVD